MNRRYCNGMVHVIKQGENLYQLSRRYRVPLALILRANPYVDVYNLQVGQEICIPVVRPFNGMICMPVQNMRDEGQRMMDGMGNPAPMQMPNGVEQEMADGMPDQAEEAEMNGMLDEEERTEMSDAPSSCPCTPQMSGQDEGDQDDDVEIYITSGDRSLGDILKEYGVEWEDFVKRNNLDQIVVGEDVVLYLPKRKD